MELEPQDRPQTMKEWLELLKNPPSRNYTSLPPTVKSPWPRRKLIKIVAGVAVLMGIKPFVKFLAYVFAKIFPNLSSSLKTFKFETVTIDARGNITNRQNRQAKYFVEDLGNGVTLEMIQIPGGTFLMGSPAGEKERELNEGPQHQVTVPSFFVGKYEVTQAQYQAIMDSNPSYFKGRKQPVEQVSWNDAVEFCKRLSQKTGRTYRLPGEAEWEYACRAGTTTPFYFGETITTDLVNYDGNYTYASAPKGQYRKQTTDVGSFPPNAFGLYDMHGNVWEWCQDTWHDSYKGAPVNGRAWIDTSSIRLMRGGSWPYAPHFCRSANRGWAKITDAEKNVGFRVVCGILTSRTS
ncbi:formylglycine-generating enzyme family protein [Chlorogloeopsis sp. ULAP01]|uniref:formylglycine-generating enzyme family protein n=1 Tax=Chlorogloeopsis sp. ULAP01 TaxID=3056483 RepID=UPI0025AA9DAC|nr:formylglycine-generating enzyme family protein [Chlorogloeopsis sp. ULAP01]MDM9379358.1 formylglycine-generating enzyme family protein [Chlorogloeopsis sp. ULAP01]